MQILILGSSAETTLPRVEAGKLAQGKINASKDQRDIRQRTCTALRLDSDEYILFDVTPETWEQAEKFGIIDKIKYIFITHPHKDRIGGLFSRYIPITTFAIKEHWKYLEKSLIALDKRIVLDKDKINLDKIIVQPFPVYHGRSTKFLVTGYKIIDQNGQSLVYLPEVRNIPKKVRPKLEKADIMIMDGSSFFYATDWHASIQEQLMWVAEYKPKKVYFTHIGYKNEPHVELEKLVKHYNKDAYICYDGQVITILNSKKDMKKIISKNFKYQEATDTALLSAHSMLHSLFESFEQKEKIEDWDKESVMSLHKSIVSELEKRNMYHYLEDSLDKDTVSNIRGKTLKFINDLNLPERLEGCKEIAQKLAYVSIKSAMGKDKIEKIEIVIKDTVRNVVLENKLAEMFGKVNQKKLSFTYDDLGSDDSYIPLFDLNLIARKSISPVLLNDDVTTLVDLSKKVNALYAKSATNAPRALFAWADVNLEDGLIIQGRISGVRTIVQKDISGIKVFVEGEDEDKASVMKEFVKVLSEIDAENFVLDGFLTTTKGVDTWKKEGTAQIAIPKEPTIDGEKLKFYVQDVIFYNGRDLHQEPLNYRLEFLSKILKASPLGIEGVPYALASTLEQVQDGLNRVFGNFDVDGAWAKILTSTYPLIGITASWFLFDPSIKNEAPDEAKEETEQSLDIVEAGETLVDNDKDKEIEDETVNKPVKK